MKSKILNSNGKFLLLCLVGMLMAVQSFAQAITVNGIVKDKTGEAVIGANVVVKGTTNGCITDFDGNFSLEANQGDILVVSFVGYQSQELPASTNMQIVLKEDAELLDDVIVIGYATGSQRTVSGAIKRVGREEMNAGVVTNPLQAIKGKIAGVNIAKTGGDPTASASIRVRGTTSLSGGNDPLVIIDGVFGDLSMLNAISPADIESFTVLKDASETAQYGSRGASGVIVVTTIKGKNGTKTLSYDGSFGIETVYKNLEMLDANAYRQIVADRGYANALDMGYSTNFIEAMQQTGYTQNHRLSFGAGTESSNYRASIGVIDQKGIILDNYMRNYTAKLDASQTMFNDKVKIDFGMFASKVDKRYVNDYQKTFYSAASFNPTFPDFPNEDGTWPEDPNANETQNPLGRLTIKDVESNSYINANARITWTVIDGLKLSAFGSYTYNVKENSKYTPTNIKAGLGQNGIAEKYDNKSGVLLGNFTANYKKAFGLHYVDILGLSELQKYSYSGFNAKAKQFGTNFFEYNNLGAGAEVKYGDVGSFLNGYSLASFMGRFNYSYADKYIATVNMRADGSSKLGANNKWGFFPSASLAWVLKEEAFLKNVDVVSNLKIRTGYGLTGNQDAISAYNSLRLMSPTGVTTINGKPVTTYGINRNENPDLKWEVKRMFDVGIDAGFFEDRLTATLDYYYSKTSDLLYNYAVPVPPFAFNTLLANLGEMENTGVEVAISGTPLKNKDMELNISANFSWQKNKLLSLSGTYMGQELNAKEFMNLGGMNGAGFIGGNNQIIYQMVGQPLGVFYLPKCDGIIDMKGNGEYTYHILDIDGQEGIDLSDGKDRYIAGQAIPKFYLGGNVNFRYKQFDIQAQFSGAFGHKIYNGTSLSYMNMSLFPTYNVLTDAPRLNIHDQTVTDYWLERGDYLHIDYVTLGWNLNTQNLKNINSLRVTFSVNNLFTFTNYSGLSPMINSSTVSSSLGIDDKQFYPLTRTYSLGLSVNF
ncbi:TonB-linked outer membrane protein%2C SusC/RagA family [uncultured Bacteroides sp.]|uniref:SusC/RagA family TonB-linked outer membrane protein n=1 Tax=Bacteroides cellulolyticus TaxID=2981780 RepID=UPI00082079C4|nr:TonB-dependent receptor [Bacteroides cellulolyticus]MCU6771583.1 TonB-dependent receptor [Bacteroides cellulolyticus]SCH90105.1 TonB-linked outer membrane protein%2C SusC/RagA family [uncultured Bacteroides sp.]